MNSNEGLISPKKQRLEQERKYRRNAIIKIAEEFFTSQGYADTMVDTIATKAGYSKATIYNYFESKDDLFIAVASKAFDKLFQTFEDTFNQPGVRFELKTLGEAYVTFLEKYPEYTGLFNPGPLGLAIGKMITKEKTKQPLTESEKEFRSHQLKIEKFMTDVIMTTMKNAGTSTNLDPFSVIMALSTLDSAIRELLVRGSREHLNVLFNIIDKGLKHYND